MSVAAGPQRRRRRTTVVTTAVLAVAALVLTGFAINYQGLTSSEVEVSNGGVWVMSEQDARMGRLNVDAGELDARLNQSGDDLDLLQSGNIVFETGARGLTPINTASVQRGGLVELPLGSTVALGDDRVAITAADGRVWILSPEEAAAFSPSGAEPAYTAEGSVPLVTVSTEGTVFVLDGTTLLRFERTTDTRDAKAAKPIEVGNLSGSQEMLELTAVGEQPVILDRENRLLRVGTKVARYSLADYGVTNYEPEAIRLQQPSAASDHFVLATEDSLFTIPFDGGEAQVEPAGGTGTPVQPAQARGCAYAAWNGSNRYVRACEGHEAAADTIPDVDSEADLSLRVNNELVILNDQRFGLSWEIMDAMAIVDNWEITQEIQTSSSEQKEKETLSTTITNIAAERDEENRAPTANNDEFGVRPGKNVVLPVARNDTDPDGDILTARVEGAQPGIGTVTPIRGGTQLQIAVNEDATGSASFTYLVDDGRGGTDTATVTLDVREDTENSAPQPVTEGITKVQVRSGQDVSVNILPYWEDPDGDAFYLTNATTKPEDVVTFQPDGLITFNDAGLATGTKQVQLTFRDEKGMVGEAHIDVEAVTDTDLAPITTGDHMSVVAGRTTTIKPLVNDLNPNGGELELTNVSETDGLEVDAALEAGTVNVTSSAPGTYYLEYTVAGAGSSTASLGIIRVDVVEPSSEDLAPVAVDDTGTVTTGADTLVDPLENDVDPTGGVLVINSISVPEDSGLKATIIGHHLVKVEAEPGAVVAEEPQPITYEVANSAGSTTGTLRVMVAKTDTQFANPIAVADRSVVRAGDMVNIDVLANDVSPTSSELHLGRLLNVESANAKGNVEPHQDRVRYSADADASGEVVLTYQVVDETGRNGSARTTIDIIPADAPNTPPRPENLTARTVAGTPVRIPIATTGIDPDGDSVLLTGITSPMPQLGEITEANGEWIEYTPDADASGTDRFQYQVMDRFGAIGTAEVLVGVAQPNELNQPPYAVDDTVEVRPEREVQIPVLDNDTDPEGAPLSVVREDVEAMSGIELIPAKEERNEGAVSVVTPAEPGTHTVLYSASDGQLSSSATITVKVDPNAPLRAPVARDDFVEAADVLDPETEFVDVDVLANDSDPDGAAGDLEVRLEGAGESATLREDGIVRITPTEEQQRLRYVITDVDGLESAGYIWVPGTAKQAPVWVGKPVEVQAGATAPIDLGDPANVRVRPGGQPATITDPSLVVAEHGDGSQLVTGDRTLEYRSAEGYSGNDTITVEVTDGELGDPTAATATLAIPVRVIAEETNLPPTFQGTLLEVEIGGPASTVDVAPGASDPEGDELTYALGEPEGSTAEVTVSMEGSVVTAKATSKAPKGTTVDVPVTVTDGTNDPVSATVQVVVGGSKQPLLAAVDDTVDIDAGRTDTIDVLRNDSNPFPGGERTVTEATRVNGTGEVVLDGNQVTITPDADFHGVLTAQYKVLDDTEDPDRMATGTITVNVRGRPEPPSAPRIGDVSDQQVELNFTAGADNSAPITGYRVTSASGPSVSQDCASTSCTITGLQNDVEYSFQVIAINEVGESDTSAASAVARPDVRPEKPAPPRATRGDMELGVAWTAPENRGSAIQRYELQMQNTATGDLQTREVEAGSTQITWGELTNGTDYRFRVRAHNLADEPSDWSDWSRAEHPAGRPAAPSGTPTAERINDPKGGGITVTWPEMTTAEANGEPITQYVVTASSGSSQTVDASSTKATFYGLDANSDHSFTYLGVNSVGNGVGSSKSSNAVTPWAVPTAPTSVSASLPDPNSGSGPDGRVDVSWEGATGNGTDIKEYVISWNGGSKTVDASTTSTRISGLKNGTAYSFKVQAKNRFQGGESELSSGSNSVTPYTTPAGPTVGGSAGKCTGANDCTIKLTASADGGDGGGGGKTLQVRIDGGSWQDSGTSYSKTFTVASGSSKTIEARVVNGKGLTSGTKKHTQKAQTWVPPDPKSSVVWGAFKTKSPACTSQYCRQVNIKVSDLDPNKTYNMTLYTNPSGGGSGADWGYNITVKPNADGTWSTYDDGGYDFLYGYPDKSFTVYLDGKAVGTHPYQG
ncbi:Ig-like domain-containing protein [Brachybacterium sp. J153]|uniref:Ig-like domain-containing protein n=1 Tax=Brachybacterium sp. J153 TaxID=3116488 RepID=UPI002E7666B1|nr:Ig-like domain-containing protein [Brachybacterium sp. J153]MEE1616811.1 Ig-like domain-containing protein [Brachybacterium sp. J153]